MVDLPIHADIVISSTQNKKIRHALRLRERRYRDATGETLIEGYREVRQAVVHGHVPSSVVYCPALFLGENEWQLLATSRKSGAYLIETSSAVFEKLSYRDRPDGILALAAKVHRPLSSLALPTKTPLVVVCEAIEKPGNLGSILRTADGAGMDAVIVCDPKTDINNPNVIRASVGTLFTVPVIEANSDETIRMLKNRGAQILVATPAGEKVYWEADFCRSTAIVVGSEQYGLSERWCKAADQRLSIPMRGKADSLNVATATSILAYEALRQRTLRQATPRES